MGTCYCTVEDVRDALESKASASDDVRIRRAIEAATAAVDEAAGRPSEYFVPIVESRHFDWPGASTSRYDRLWLGDNFLIELTSATTGGYYLAPAALKLLPTGPGPYTRIEIDASSGYAWTYTGTPQRSITITGVWGHSTGAASAGALVGTINDSVTSLVVSDGAAVGIGDNLIIDTERLEVTGKAWEATGETLAGDVAASSSGTTIPVTSGASFALDELVLVDGERMRVVDVAGNTLVVRRAVDGSTLAAHATGSTVYARRRLTVVRAARGTSATSHADGAIIYRHVVPADVLELAVAEASTTLLQGRAGYAREVGPEGATTRIGAGLPELRQRVADAYRRAPRMGAV